VKRLPEKFLESLEGIEGFDKDAFVKVHELGEQVTSIRVNPWKTTNGKRETANSSIVNRQSSIQGVFLSCVF